ncbi:MAG TPA: J domain-containing protein [Bacteroidales bacterium]|nr:J domain-containing protein [Bacteroidales bacterium]
MFIDYYKALGLDKNASQAQIKSAYRKLARKYHPDLNPDDRDAKKNFQLINEANEVLSDPEKRAKYDQYGKDWRHAEEYQHAEQSTRQQYASGGSGRRGNFTGAGNNTEFSDFFESLFGEFRGTSHGRKVKFRGEDYNADLHLSLRDVYQSRKQELEINGKKIRITIPAGVENEQTIKITGMGSQGINGGPNGDLYIKFVIDNDTSFKRLKNDLYKTIDIDLYTAILGGETIIDSMDGKIRIKVKPGTQTGSRVKLKGKGFPVYKSDNEFGDLIITFNVKVPENISAEEKEIFTKLAEIHRKRQEK